MDNSGYPAIDCPSQKKICLNFQTNQQQGQLASQFGCNLAARAKRQKFLTAHTESEPTATVDQPTTNPSEDHEIEPSWLRP